jgi:hypothetical protein
MNPFLAFCLYVASRVVIQYLKWNPNDSQSMATLHLFMAAMHSFKRRNPFAEPLLLQLEVDIEGTAIQLPGRTTVNNKNMQLGKGDAEPQVGIFVESEIISTALPSASAVVEQYRPNFEAVGTVDRSAAFFDNSFTAMPPDFPNSASLDPVNAGTTTDLDATYGSFSGDDRSQHFGPSFAFRTDLENSLLDFQNNLLVVDPTTQRSRGGTESDETVGRVDVRKLSVNGIPPFSDSNSATSWSGTLP